MMRKISIKRKPKISPNSLPSYSWWHWRDLFVRMKYRQQTLIRYQNMMEDNLSAGQIASRYFCLAGERYITQKEMAKKFHCAPSVVNAKIGAVLSFLFPIPFKKKRRGGWLQEQEKKILEEARKRKNRENMLNGILPINIGDIGDIPPEVTHDPKLSLEYIMLLHAQQRGLLDRLRKVDATAYRAVSLRFGLEDGHFHTIKEVASKLFAAGLITSSSKQTAARFIDKGIAILAGSMFLVTPLLAKQIRMAQKKE